LHPYRDDPSDSLAFGLKGVITGLDDRGKTTIGLCKLDRPELNGQRQKAQENAWPVYLDYAAQGKLNEFAADFRAQAYYAAVASYINYKWENIRPQL
jgi:hypothetical protein